MRLWFAVVWLAVLSGCAPEMPFAKNFALTRQRVMNSAAHWQLLANETAAQLAPKLQAEAAVSVVLVRKANAESSAFYRGFEELLAAALVQHGVGVASGATPGTATYTVEVNVQTVHHQFPAISPIGFTQLGTVLGMSVWAAVAQPAVAIDAVPALGVAAGAVWDAARYWAPEPTSTEILVTTAVTKAGTRVSGTSEVFYIQSPDVAAYEPRPAEPRKAAIINGYREW